MKISLFIFLFLFYTNLSFSQLEPARVVLKSGDTISSIIGKIKRKTFKYKESYSGKTKKIDLSKINIIEFKINNNKEIYYIFKDNLSDKYLKVRPSIIGSNLELELFYKTYTNASSPVNGITIHQEIVHYYIKRKDKQVLSYIGTYNPLGSKYRNNVMLYFKDCPKLLEKIREREFRLRAGLAPIVEYYNKYCN